jgi:predicted  nucleic acid-binding Zn-ribbon protein
MAEKHKSAANGPGGQQGGPGVSGDQNVLLAGGGIEDRDDEREEDEQEDEGDDDPVRRAEVELERAANKLADAKDKAKRDDEIAKAIEQYRAVQLRLEADQTALGGQLDEGLKNLAPTEGEIDAVKDVREEVREEINDLRNLIQRRSRKLEMEREALARGKLKLAETKDDFEGLKNRGKGVQDKHRVAETLIKEAFDAIPRKRRLAYYLLAHRLAPTISGEPNPIELADFIKEIHQKSSDYGQQSRRLADLEASIKRREKALTDYEKKLADLKKNREATIRERLAAQA